MTELLVSNDLVGHAYIEPYAGGASLALALLERQLVSEVHLNDLDDAIYAFWYSVFNYSSELISLILKTPITPSQWARQKRMFQNRQGVSTLQLGFATFFLNRTNYSGILNGGMIGGKQQAGRWRLDARYNREELCRRILTLASLRDRIHVTNLDATEILSRRLPQKSVLYIDPPYYTKGRRLYLNHYRPADHAHVRDFTVGLSHPWVVSYDDSAEIQRLYKGYPSMRVRLPYAARSPRQGSELLIFSRELILPAELPK